MISTHRALTELHHALAAKRDIAREAGITKGSSSREAAVVVEGGGRSLLDPAILGATRLIVRSFAKASFHDTYWISMRLYDDERELDIAPDQYALDGDPKSGEYFMFTTGSALPRIARADLPAALALRAKWLEENTLERNRYDTLGNLVHASQDELILAPEVSESNGLQIVRSIAAIPLDNLCIKRHIPETLYGNL
ncbi:MAG: hypothetical protein AAF413_00995 [Patescibacteria group bacterium]